MDYELCNIYSYSTKQFSKKQTSDSLQSLFFTIQSFISIMSIRRITAIAVKQRINFISRNINQGLKNSFNS